MTTPNTTPTPTQRVGQAISEQAAAPEKYSKLSEVALQLATELEAAQKENAELKKDKERLSWLLGKFPRINIMMEDEQVFTCRAAIDAAMQPKEGK